MKTEQRFSSVFSLAEKASLPQVNLVRIKSGRSKRSADDFFIRRNVMLKFCLTVPVLKDAEEKIIFRIEKLADECIGSAQERYFPTASIKKPPALPVVSEFSQIVLSFQKQGNG